LYPRNKRFFNNYPIVIDTLNSTQDYLKEVVKSSKKNEFICVIAKHQTRGRGQRGNQWHGNLGENLYLSFLWPKPKIKAEDIFDLNILISLSILDASRTYLTPEIAAKLKIKWPNDLYYEENKFAGILIENSWSQALEYSIIGIGINVNQQEFTHIPKATSISKILEKKIDLQEFTDNLLEIIQRYITNFDTSRNTNKTLYLDHLYLKDVLAPYRIENRDFLGKIIGIDDFGRLQISESETIHTCQIKEITFLA
jgi:BirA family biotin operon repressor/biotin-[acetyl-CoA-carboxylase] ligase